MTRFTNLIILFVTITLGGGFILDGLHQGVATICWVVGILIGQAYGQVLSKYYAKGHTPKWNEPELEGVQK